MLNVAELASVLPQVPRISVHGPWIRAIGFHALRQSQNPLWASRGEGRFCPRDAFPALHLASDEITALAEVKDVFHHRGIVRPVHLRPAIWTCVPVDGVVTNVIDLVDPAVQRVLNTNVSELTGIWRVGYPRGVLPPTQLLGAMAFEIGIVTGFRYTSSRAPEHGINCLIFVDRLRIGVDYLEVIDRDGTLTRRLP